MIGISFVLMIVFVILSVGIVEEYAEGPRDDIALDDTIFILGLLGYLIVLILDIVIALAFYSLLNPIRKDQAKICSVYRLLYSAIMIVSLIALMAAHVDAYNLGMHIAYAFFISHVFILGALVQKSGFIPKGLGTFLIIASFCYVILLYGDSIIPSNLFNTLFLVAIIPATFAEISLGIWLLLKGTKIPNTDPNLSSSNQ